MRTFPALGSAATLAVLQVLHLGLVPLPHLLRLLLMPLFHLLPAGIVRLLLLHSGVLPCLLPFQLLPILVLLLE